MTSIETHPRRYSDDLVQNPPAQDWLISTVLDLGPAHFYRYRVTGENLNWPAGHRDRAFTWSIPDSPKDNPRYDLTSATWKTA